MLWTWLIIIIILIILEAVTVDLVTIWYIASALVSLVLSLFIDSFFIQFLVFVLLGTLLLITTRKQLVRIIGKKDEKTNLDRVVGMRGIVTEDISKNKMGAVKVDGKEWTAVSNKRINKDSVVNVLSIDGVKLKVEEVDD